MVTERTTPPQERLAAHVDCTKCYLCDKCHFELSRMTVQSADVVDNPVSSGDTTSQVLTFVDSSTGGIDDVGYIPDGIASADATSNTGLDGFLKRPTLIDSRTWTTATTTGALGSVIEPWYLYLNNSVITNKLKNYAFLRAKLCIKIVVNATPFHFGLVRVAYEPSINATNTGDRYGKIRVNPSTSAPYIIPYSQLPGTWVLPADNAGGEIHVPFFRFNNWLPLTSAAAAKTMGNLSYYCAYPLTVASSSGSTSITIDTFAWLEDVELMGSTNELTLQGKDEYDGPISKPASAIATIASRLEDVPVIGRFARATQIGASAIAGIASIFGFTNAPVIDDVHAFVPAPGIHLASSEISTPVQKLSLDPKQELSIDPRMHGLTDKDELAICNIVDKKSALTMQTWSTTDAVGTVLFNSRVSPLLFNKVSINDGGAVERALRVYHTPLSYLAMLFQHWRGDIMFEFTVICTKYHKGRLKISWDPIGSSGTSALPENTVYTTILDIGENNKAVLRVPYHQAYGFLRCRGVTAFNWSSNSTMGTDDRYDNGQLVVSVLTPLMSPVAPQTTGVLVSVYAADNFEFANPRSTLGEAAAGTYKGVPPSFFDVQSADIYDIDAREVTLGDKGSKHPNRYDQHFGERIVSLRTVLHRYSIYDISSMEKQTPSRVSLFTKSYTRLPPSFGYDPNGKSTANKLLVAGTANFNYTPTHPSVYIANMYGAFKGSMNYIVNTSCDLYPYIGDIRVQRITGDTIASDRLGGGNSGINTGTTKSAFLKYMNFQIPYPASGGACFTNTQTNGSINWNCPMMAGVNFNFTDPNYSITGNGKDQTDNECSYLEAYIKQATGNTVTDLVTFTTYAGTGVDYTCLWWLCCPTVDYYAGVPTAP